MGLNRSLGVCFFALAGIAVAQPVIFTNGIVNGASFVPAGLPNSSIAQGSIFSIFGSGLATTTKQVSDEGFPLKTTSDGTTIDVVAGGATVKALLLYISPAQINAILPSTVPVGQATVTVTTAGVASNAQAINVVRSSFGIITRNSAGSGPGIVFNFNSESNQPTNSVIEAAYPGQTVILWGTGLGPVTFDESRRPSQGNLDTAVEITVGGQKVTPQYKGRSLFAGLDQINFQLPANVPTACYVPVTIKVGPPEAAVVSNAATIAIAPAQGQRACTDPLSFGGRRADQIVGGTVRQGTINLNRTIAELPGQTFATDVAVADFTRSDVSALLASHSQFGISSVGSCVTYSFRGDSSDFIDPVPVQGIDAGTALTLTLPGGGTKLLNKVDGQSAGVYLTPFDPTGASWLVPGNYTIDVPGASNGVGQFRATLTVPGALTWTNIGAIATAPRNAALPITWSGGDTGDIVLISGASSIGGVGAGFNCLTQNAAGSFTVPADVLSVLPATGTGTDDVGVLIVGGLPPASRPSVTITPTPQGLDVANFTYLFSTAKLVTYQ
ncbi:MAG TPA: hypothetical protein VN428_12375 [Bryobacteraceae bacterium]|nr:hypothetical protein [Bryobacteraceae bacterium]